MWNYIKETKGELKHVAWPTRKQAIEFTGLVLVISIVVAAYLGVLDLLFAQALKFLLA